MRHGQCGVILISSFNMQKCEFNNNCSQVSLSLNIFNPNSMSAHSTPTDPGLVSGRRGMEGEWRKDLNKGAQQGGGRVGKGKVREKREWKGGQEKGEGIAHCWGMGDRRPQLLVLHYFRFCLTG